MRVYGQMQRPYRRSSLHVRCCALSWARKAVALAGSMGIMPGTTICGLADGHNWAVRTVVNKFRGEFEARVRPAKTALQGVALTSSANAT